MRPVTVFSILLSLYVAIPANARSSEIPDALIGAWDGEGALFDRPAAFRMTWEWVLGGKFLQLNFSNGFVTEDGIQPVLEAVALYKPLEGGRLEGTWFDTRGVAQPLRGTMDKNSLTVTWGTPETEEGRTTYRLHEEGIRVEDSVKREGEWSVFGTADYQRSPR